MLPVALLGTLAAAHAQHQMIVERLKAWDAAAPKPDEQRLATQVRGAAERIYPADNRCDVSALTIESARPAMADRFAFNGILRGTMRGAWFVTTRVPGCDDAPVRFMVMQNADESFHTVRVNRGISYAWESLISDTLPLAATAAYGALKRQNHECAFDGKAALGVTRIAAQDANLGEDVFGIRYSGAWAETWPMTLCGKTVEVRVNFRADGDGGAYTDLPGDEARILP